MTTPNLDAMDATDLWSFWAEHRHATKADALALFGRTGRGTRKAAASIAAYACNKSVAMQCRARGDIVGAQNYEAICDRIYKQLPSFAKTW